VELLEREIEPKRLRLYQLRSSGEWRGDEARSLRRDLKTLSRALHALDPKARYRARLFMARKYALAVGGGVTWRGASKLYGYCR